MATECIQLNVFKSTRVTMAPASDDLTGICSLLARRRRMSSPRHKGCPRIKTSETLNGLPIHGEAVANDQEDTPLKTRFLSIGYMRLRCERDLGLASRRREALVGASGDRWLFWAWAENFQSVYLATPSSAVGRRQFSERNCTGTLVAAPVSRVHPVCASRATPLGTPVFFPCITTAEIRSRRALVAIGDSREVSSNAGMKGRGKRYIPEKTRRPAASSGTIPLAKILRLPLASTIMEPQPTSSLPDCYRCRFCDRVFTLAATSDMKKQKASITSTTYFLKTPMNLISGCNCREPSGTFDKLKSTASEHHLSRAEDRRARPNRAEVRQPQPQLPFKIHCPRIDTLLLKYADEKKLRDEMKFPLEPLRDMGASRLSLFVVLQLTVSTATAWWTEWATAAWRFTTDRVYMLVDLLLPYSGQNIHAGGPTASAWQTEYSLHAEYTRWWTYTCSTADIVYTVAGLLISYGRHTTGLLMPFDGKSIHADVPTAAVQRAECTCLWTYCCSTSHIVYKQTNLLLLYSGHSIHAVGLLLPYSGQGVHAGGSTAATLRTECIRLRANCCRMVDRVRVFDHEDGGAGLARARRPTAAGCPVPACLNAAGLIAVHRKIAHSSCAANQYCAAGDVVELSSGEGFDHPSRVSAAFAWAPGADTSAHTIPTFVPSRRRGFMLSVIRSYRTTIRNITPPTSALKCVAVCWEIRFLFLRNYSTYVQCVNLGKENKLQMVTECHFHDTAHIGTNIPKPSNVAENSLFSDCRMSKCAGQIRSSLKVP
ncbi:hypothetical protein PR048_030457 [Dryococelus australis]|uniref:Uncharacterized protein n=1 Tax=Dryococelus australis TaxID=614101 RepID=A0ABQ9GBM2_9NEOP|nr:hypothetical protein PR048_030457 [Dryococelus australis]